MRTGSVGLGTSINTGFKSTETLPSFVPVPASGVGGVVYKLKGRLRSNMMQREPVKAGTFSGSGSVSGDKAGGGQSDLDQR